MYVKQILVSTREIRILAANGRRLTAETKENEMKTTKGKVLKLILGLLLILVLHTTPALKQWYRPIMSKRENVISMCDRVFMRNICFTKKTVLEIFPYVEKLHNLYGIGENKDKFIFHSPVARKMMYGRGGRGQGRGGAHLLAEKKKPGRPTKAEMLRRAEVAQAMAAANAIAPSNKISQATLDFSPNTTLTMLTPMKPLMSVPVVTPTQEPTQKKQVMNPPQLRPVNNEKTTQANDEVTTTYISRVQYRRHVRSSPNVILLMKTIAAAMMQYNRTVQLLPFDDENKNNPLITARDIPDEVEEFSIYVPYAKVTKKGLLFMRFKIQADAPLWRLKQHKGIKAMIDRNGIYLDQTYLKSKDNIKIGGFLMSHCQYTRREQANKEINDRINFQEESQLELQLTPHLYWHGSGGNRVSTRMMAAECSREMAKEVRERIYQKLMFIPDEFKFGNTRHFHFIPFTTTISLTDDAIRNSVMLQNQYLLDISAITLKYMNNTCWKVPDTSMSFLEVVLTAEDGAIPPAKLFNNVEVATGYDKVFLMTFKVNLEKATAWVDEFIDNLKKSEIQDDQWEKFTGVKRIIQRVDKAGSSDAEKAYSCQMMKQLNLGGRSDKNKAGPIMAPPKNAWTNRVLYGPSEVTPTLTQTSVSTLTQDKGKTMITSDLDKKFQDVEDASQATHRQTRDAMIKELKDMNDKANVRAKTLEDIVKKNDEVTTGLWEYNRHHAGEVEKQTKYIASIDERTEAQSEQMKVLQAQNEEISVQQIHIQEFMTQISKTVNELRSQLCTQSESDQEQGYYDILGDAMEIDKSSRKRSQPSSAAKGSLGDEGCNK